jgi:hypothetical protein
VVGRRGEVGRWGGGRREEEGGSAEFGGPRVGSGSDRGVSLTPAGQYFKVHRVELDGTHPLVREARDGDRVVVWVRAMEPGWQNVVK